MVGDNLVLAADVSNFQQHKKSLALPHTALQ